MGLDLWFRQDVARILASTWETMQATSTATQPGNGSGSVATSDERLAAAYRRGFEDALRAVGIAFGLNEDHGSSLNSGVRQGPAQYPRTWLER
jgi:hypothetical protein